jgi:toluene monooxygenase system protein E
MTYARYVEARKEKEAFLDGLLDSQAAAESVRTLQEPWLGLLDRVMCPLRYPFHGLQMASAYARWNPRTAPSLSWPSAT